MAFHLKSCALLQVVTLMLLQMFVVAGGYKGNSFLPAKCSVLRYDIIQPTESLLHNDGFS